MEKFEHTQASCKQRADERQQELLMICRKMIYDEVIESVKNSSPDIKISLDERLDNIHRTKLIEELLDRFKTINLIKTTSNNPQQKGSAEFCISDKKDIKDDITGIRILL